jgi:hypothetical protein
MRTASDGSSALEPEPDPVLESGARLATDARLDASLARDTRRDVMFAAIVALVLALVGYALNGHGAMNLQDEGFLWYGVVHTLEGQVPLRDFRAYDPARYYWCAEWARIFGDGFLALRLSCALFQAVGLTFGLLAAQRVVSSRWLLPLVGVVLALWFFPPEKPFEASAATASVWIATRLIERPTRGRHFAAGVVTGIAALFGRNLGVYSCVAFVALIAYLHFKFGAERKTAEHATARSIPRAHTPVWPALGAFALGVAAGYAPMLAMIAFVPGFGASFVESVAFYARQKSLNAPLPVPWPWTVDYSGMSAFAALSHAMLGVWFVIAALFYLVALWVVLRTSGETLRRRALFVAALAVGAVYAHHASVRSDVNHLAQCIHPLLLGMLSIPLVLPAERVAREEVSSERDLPSRRTRTRATAAILALLLAASALAIAPRQPFAHELRARGTPNPFVPFDAHGDTVWINRAKARYLSAIVATVNARVKPEESLWIAPGLLTLYPLLGRTSPVWDIYPAWSAGAAEEERMLREMTRVEWVLWIDQPTDDGDAIQLANTHPAVWKKLTDEFERAPTPELASSILLLHRKHG